MGFRLPSGCVDGPFPGGAHPAPELVETDAAPTFLDAPGELTIEGRRQALDGELVDGEQNTPAPHPLLLGHPEQSKGCSVALRGPGSLALTPTESDESEQAREPGSRAAHKTRPTPSRTLKVPLNSGRPPT